MSVVSAILASGLVWGALTDHRPRRGRGHVAQAGQPEGRQKG